MTSHHQTTSATGSFLSSPAGLASWVGASDHKRIGVLYLATSLLFLAVAVLLGLALRLEVATASGGMFSAEGFREVLSLRTSLLVFLVATPALVGGLGNMVLPQMIGAQGVKFPGLNRLSYYAYLVGGVLLVADGGVRGGDLSAGVVGASLAGFSGFLLGVNFLATLHLMRAPGVCWTRVPMFAWSIYAVSVLNVLLAPLLGLATALAVAVHLWTGSEAPLLGVGPVLVDHVGWFQGGAALYVLAIPVVGIVSDVVAVHARRRLAGYHALAFCCLTMAMLGSLSWSQSVIVGGASVQALAARSFVTFLLVVPALVMIGALVATLHRSSIRLSTPMWYALACLIMLTAGVLVGLFPATLAVGVHLGATAFGRAFESYMLMGGVVLALFAGLYHWWPQLTGRLYDDKAGHWGCLLLFVGFSVAFFSDLVMGSQGMPAGVSGFGSASPEMADLFLNGALVAVSGACLAAAGFFLALATLVRSMLSGATAEANPWNGESLEWRTASPPPTENFVEVPVCEHGPYEFEELEDLQRGAAS